MKCQFTIFHFTLFIAGILSCLSFLQYSKEYSLSQYVFALSSPAVQSDQPNTEERKVSEVEKSSGAIPLKPEVEKLKKVAEILMERDREMKRELHDKMEIKEDAKGPAHYKMYVSMSSTADNYYLESLPLAALAWIRLGVQPLVCLVGEPKEYETNLTKTSIDLLKKLNTTITYLEGKITLKKATIAQHCRLHAAKSELQLKGEDVIIISDSDYIPIHRERHWAEGVDLFLYNSQCCGYESHQGQQFPHLTVLTMAMTVATFREVLQFSQARYENATSIEADLIKNFGNAAFQNDYAGANELTKLYSHRMWYSDQILISYRVHDWKKKKFGPTRTGEWSTVGARLDRASWPPPADLEKLDINTYADMHLMRPAMQKWLDIRPVFKKLLSPELYKLADDYGTELLRTSQDIGPNSQSFN